MAIQVLSTMPDAVTAGETFKVQFPNPLDYPAGVWALKVAFIGPESFTIEAGADNLLTVATADTENRAPGVYTWRAYVEAAGERVFLSGTGWVQYGAGQILLRPNPLTVSSDLTWAQECLAQLRLHIRGRLPAGLTSHTIAGTAISKMDLKAAIELERVFMARVRQITTTLAALSDESGEDDSIKISFDRP